MPEQPMITPTEQAICNVNNRFRDWKPTPAMLGYARGVGREVERIMTDDAAPQSPPGDQPSLTEERAREALSRIAALTPSRANAETAEDLHATVAAIAESALAFARENPSPDAAAPIDMLLYCPSCGLQHVDEPEHIIGTGGFLPEEPGDAWDNPPHRSHLCHGCGCIWRPADVATNGVRAIGTAGKADTWAPVERLGSDAAAIIEQCAQVADYAVERVARALCVEAGHDPDDLLARQWCDEGKCYAPGTDPMWTLYTGPASAAIRALSSPTIPADQGAADTVLVPRVPTIEMLAAFWRQKNCGTQDVEADPDPTQMHDYAAYAAMLAAAPTYTPPSDTVLVERRVLENLRALSDRATSGPWCWEQCGDKSDDPVVGIAYLDEDSDCKNPLSGQLRDFDGEGREIKYYRETIAYGFEHCDGCSPSSNADFVVAAVNFVRAALEATPASSGAG